MDRQSRQLAILLVRGGAEYPGILFHGVWLAKYRCLRQFIGQAERFHCGSQVASYMGLVPAEDSSGERQRLGHISKQGNTLLRFLPVEAAQVTVRGDAEWRRKYFHLALRRGRKIAKVAMARRLAVRRSSIECSGL